jgi:hypothetical protein
MKNEIRNDRIMTRSGDPKQIIIAPLFALMANGTVYHPNLVRASYKYSWPAVQDYFYYTLSKESPPMHVFSELLEQDFVYFLGASVTYRSWWLDELASMGALPSEYKNALLMVCQDDWREQTPDRRMLRGLCNFAISPMMKTFSIGREHVLHIDEVLVQDAFRVAQSQDRVERRFNLEPSRYYDPNWLQVILKDYPK